MTKVIWTMAFTTSTIKKLNRAKANLTQTMTNNTLTMGKTTKTMRFST
jgi:hypothetical protein